MIRFSPKVSRDTAEDAAYLPLLQVTLEELWRKGSLTLGAYGNLSDAIEQRADKVIGFEDYDEVTPRHPRLNADQSMMLELFLDLVDPSLDDNAKRDVRRRRTRDALTAGSAQRGPLN